MYLNTTLQDQHYILNFEEGNRNLQKIIAFSASKKLALKNGYYKSAH